MNRRGFLALLGSLPLATRAGPAATVVSIDFGAGDDLTAIVRADRGFLPFKVRPEDLTLIYRSSYSVEDVRAWWRDVLKKLDLAASGAGAQRPLSTELPPFHSLSWDRLRSERSLTAAATREGFPISAARRSPCPRPSSSPIRPETAS